MRHLDASSAGEVPVEVELLLQFERLMTRVRRARSLSVDAVRSIDAFETHQSTDCRPIAFARNSTRIKQ